MPHRCGMVSQQPERKFIDTRYCGLVAQIRQLVFDILLSRRGNEFQFHHCPLRSGIDDQAWALRALGKVLLHQQGGQGFFSGGPQPLG